MLDLESDVLRGLGSIPTGGNILSLDFLFSLSKASDANIGIIAKSRLTDIPFTRGQLRAR